jgi:hypothetical protein
VKHDGVNIVLVVLEIHRGPVRHFEYSSCAAILSFSDFIELKSAAETVNIVIQRTCKLNIYNVCDKKY